MKLFFPIVPTFYHFFQLFINSSYEALIYILLASGLDYVILLSEGGGGGGGGGGGVGS